MFETTSNLSLENFTGANSEGMLRPALRSAFAAEHGGGGMGLLALEVDPIKLLHGAIISY